MWAGTSYGPECALPRKTIRSRRRTSDLLNISDVANHLGVSARHVRRLVTERRIPYIKWGHLLRFDPRELQAWLNQSRVEPRRF